MAKGYKYQATIPLERTIKVGEEAVSNVNTSSAVGGKGKDSKKPGKPGPKDPKKEKPQAPSAIPAGMKRGETYTQHVGTLTVELSL